MIRGFNNVETEAWFQIAMNEVNIVCTRSNTVIRGKGEERRSAVVERQRVRIDKRANCFRMRAAKIWNELPDDVRNSNSVHAIKNAYDAWTTSKQEQPGN